MLPLTTLIRTVTKKESPRRAVGEATLEAMEDIPQ